MRIAILLSGAGTTMQAIAEAITSARLNIEIVAVCSDNPKAQGIALARDIGLKTEVLDYQRANTREDFCNAFSSCIESYQPDYLILAGFMRILTASFINQFKSKIINIHPSLLPKYKGLNTHRRALESGDSEHGSSVHLVTEVLDDGPIIAQAITPIQANIQFNEEQTQALEQKVKALEKVLYPLCLTWLANKRIAFHSGEVQLDGRKLPKTGMQYDEVSLKKAWEEERLKCN